MTDNNNVGGYINTYVYGCKQDVNFYVNKI